MNRIDVYDALSDLLLDANIIDEKYLYAIVDFILDNFEPKEQ